MTDLGRLSDFSTLPNAVSNNGAAVTGFYSGFNGTSWITRSFRWTSSGGVEDLGTVDGGPSANSQGFDISGDGLTVVGSLTAVGGGSTNAFRWTASSGMQAVNIFGVQFSEARAISHDGTTIVGSGMGQAFRWTATAGGQQLGFLPGGTFSTALDVSADGSVVVGTANPAGNLNGHAFRWSQSTGMQDLGVLPGADDSVANAVSSNGSVIVGFSQINSAARPFRWTPEGGMQNLGLLPGGTYAVATGVSGNGSIVVGYADRSGNGAARPFVWTPGGGMVSIEQYLSARGVVLGGWDLWNLAAVSPDGTAMTGVGDLNGVPRAWLVRGVRTCSASDVAGPNQGASPDGQLSADDIIVFLAFYFTGDPRGDVAGLNQSSVPDGAFTADDIIVFLSRYFQGCTN
jgi:probable HAF family extracellular repeat protein